VAVRDGPRAMTAVRAGARRALALWAHGQGVNGALGLGHTAPVKEPVRVLGGVARAAAGWGHSAVLTDTGQLVLSGRTHDVQQIIRFGRLQQSESPLLSLYEMFGSKNSIDSLEPAVVDPAPFSGSGRLCEVVASAGLTAVVSEDGKLFMMGNNVYGQCADGTRDQFIYKPSQVKGLDGPVAQVALGFRHGIALTRAGKVFCWGKGGRGQVGQGKGTAQDYLTAVKVARLPGRAVEIAAGFNHSLALLEDGRVFVWGKFQKQTEDKVDFEDAFIPIQVDFNGVAVRRIWAGYFHSVALTSTNQLFQWGRLSDKAVSAHPDVRKQIDAGETQLARSTVVRPVSVQVSSEWVMDHDLEVSLGTDLTYVTASSLDRPLVWDWNLSPVPLDLFEPRCVDLVRSHRVRRVVPGWQHTLYLTEEE